MRLINILNQKFRAKPIAKAILPLIEEGKTILDIGCFDGTVSHELKKTRPELKIQGIDIKLPKEVLIPAKIYDGQKIPFKDNSFDHTIIIDILHHVENPVAILREAKRVTKKSIIIKDIVSSSLISNTANYAVDLIGGLLTDVDRPKKYYTIKGWKELFKKTGLKIEYFDTNFKLNFIDLESHLIAKVKK